jgi:hypothetical protein
VYQGKAGYWHIHLNGYKRLEKYLKLIGWSNSKHLNKIKKWKFSYPEISKNVNV